MTLSISLALLGTVAGFTAVLALVVRYSGSTSDQQSRAIAQAGNIRLHELERSGRSAGRDGTSADEARIKLLRELLETACTGQSQWWLLRGDRGAVAVIGLTALAMGCFSLLSVIDRAVPTALTTSTLAQDADIARLELYANSAPKIAGAKNAAPKVGGMSEPQDLPDVETMIERLAARLQAAPEDADGWRMLGWSYFNIRQASKAAEAYARAVALQPQSSEIQTAYGEALVAAEAGTVTSNAIKSFNLALALDAGNGKARYFIALAMQQAGKKKEALEAWISLQAEPLGDEAWVGELRERTQTLARELKVDLPARIPLPVVGQAANTPGWGSRQPTAEEIQSIQQLPADEQQVLIRGMVSALADRLQKQPRDEEGWLQLIRSRLVLGEDKAAREALSRALAVFSQDDPAGARIAAAAKELGVTNN